MAVADPPLSGSVRLYHRVSAYVPSPDHIVDPSHARTIPLPQKTKMTWNQSEKVVIRVTIPSLSYEISACRNLTMKRVAFV